MKTATPTLKTRPPKTAPQAIPPDETAARLQALDTWTEVPAKEAAAEIAVEEGAKPARKARPPAPAAEKRRRAPPKPPVAPAASPWLVVTQEDSAPPAIKLANFKLPAPLYAKMRWLAQTTYGYTMTRLVIEALEAKMDEMLEQRGIVAKRLQQTGASPELAEAIARTSPPAGAAGRSARKRS